MIRTRLILLIAYSMILMGNLVGVQGAELQQVTLLLDWFPNADHVPIYVAQEKGIFAKHGLEVEVIPPTNPADPIKLVAAGKFPLAVSYQPSVTIARAAELPIKSIGVLVDHPLNTISFLKKSGIEVPGDLRGKKIGYTVAPLDLILFETIAQKASLTKDDYELISIGFNISPSLLSGSVDAVIGAFWNYEINELLLEGVEANYFPLEEHGVPDYYELVFITNDKYLLKNRKTVKEFVLAIKEAIELTKKHPYEALTAYFTANPNVRKDLDLLAFTATLPMFAKSQQQSQEKWEKFTAFGFNNKLITRKIEAADLFDNVLVGEGN